MIIQGTNIPIIFTFSQPMNNIIDIEISLYTNCSELKHWSIEDVEINDDTITAPLSQRQTIHFPAGKCNIEVKWTDEDGMINFARNIPNTIMERHDKTLMEEL